MAAPFAIHAQTCTALGQTPATAFPVCGTDTFSQSTVPVCGNTNMPVPCNDGAQYQDKNPFWYKFTCFSSGTLGFTIAPNTAADDYDWQLFDITGHNPADVYTNASLFVSCNWSGNSGNTGASSAGTTLVNCAGFAYPTFSSMPAIIKGHQYILLISHFSGDSQSGYKLSFSGGTASITDPTSPKLLSAKAYCDEQTIGIKLNKSIKCKSLTATGSEFSISPAVAKVVSATAVGCSSSFDTDSLIIFLSKPVKPGSYTIIINNGSDANSLLDNCNRNIAPGDHVPLTVLPIAPTPMDSISPVGCSPNQLQLVFQKNILCASIAPNGSDFVVTGDYPVTVVSASGSCSNGSSNIVTVTLSKPLTAAGNFKITLVKGSDGNTLLDECTQETPVNSSLNFSTVDNVSAQFDYFVFKGCNSDTIAFVHDGANGVNNWNWTFDNSSTSNLQNVINFYSVFGIKQAKLVVSNGVCTDSFTAKIDLGTKLKASFTAPDLICPEDLAIFKSTSTGSNILSYNWNFGDGVTSIDSIPAPQKYPFTTRELIYYVRLVVGNDANCFDTAYKPLKVLYNCYIAVPSAFTPNGDGLNDYLYPLNAYKAINLQFRVFNRYGQLVFETKDWTKKWDGRVNGVEQAAGTYVWMLNYTNRDTQQQFSLKGTTVLIR